MATAASSTAEMAYVRAMDSLPRQSILEVCISIFQKWIVARAERLTGCIARSRIRGRRPARIWKRMERVLTWWSTVQVLPARGSAWKQERARQAGVHCIVNGILLQLMRGWDLVHIGIKGHILVLTLRQRGDCLIRGFKTVAWSAQASPGANLLTIAMILQPPATNLANCMTPQLPTVHLCLPLWTT